MANRTVTMPGVWAKNAIDVPGTPAKGTVYADTGITSGEIEAGWPFAEIVESSKVNELLRRITGMLASLETTGVLNWCAVTAYVAGGLATGSDGQVYKSLADNNLNHDPVSSPAYWASWPPAVAAVPVGAVGYFAGATPPSGWLEADGSQVSRSTYAALFAYIGTTFGAGNGSTTFTLPDLRGEFIRGWDHGRGVDAGRVRGSWQKGSLEVIDNGPTPAVISLRDNNSVNSDVVTRALAGLDNYTAGDYTGLYQEYTNPTGGVAVDPSTAEAATGMTRPRNVALLPCIKY